VQEQTATHRRGPKMKICPKCNNEHNKNGIYCSRSCANSRTWSEQDKQKKSTSALNSEKVSNANKSKAKRKLLSEKTKQKHDLGLLTGWTDKQRAKAKQIRRQKSIENKKKIDNSDKLKYRAACKFLFNVYQYPNEFNLSLLMEHGWYSATNRGNNINGISRDHMLSINDGYMNNISPYKISHPANCRLISQTSNFEKRDASIIDEKALDNLIAIWEHKYGKY